MHRAQAGRAANRRTTVPSVCLAVLAAVLLVAASASAQQGTAELRGTVLDQQNAVLRNVAVSIRNQDTGVFRTTRTNADGTYFVGGLAPGRYEIRARLAGFRPLARPGVRLEVGRTTAVNLTLQIGPIDDAVIVAAETPLLDVTSKEIGGYVTSRELVDLPSANRSFIGFIGLLPGVVPIAADSLGADAISANATDPRSNSFLLDGANNNDDFLGQRAGTQVRTPLEAVQEFQVLTHQFDAEFGRATGAVVNAVTRQGGNAFHGSAFSFFQDDALTARDYFSRQNRLARPEAAQQQYGGTVGGPIARNKAHFFASLEVVRLDRAATVNIPSRVELNTAATTTSGAWNTLVRFDQQLTAAHTWGVRWLRESSPQDNLLIPIGGRQVATDAPRQEADVDQTTVGVLHSVLGNTRVNTLRVAFTRENVAFANPGFNTNGRRQDLLPPTLQHQTFIAQQSDVAQARIANAWSVDDTVSWFIPGRLGNHDLKFGFQYQHGRADSTNQGVLNGRFEFGSDAPFDAGNPHTYPERLQIRVPGGSDLEMTGHFVSAFAQDKWRLGERLTLTLGVRYDVEWIPLDESGNPAFPDSGRYPVDTDNLAPRLGFAYRIDPSGRSVLRGGYGVFFDKTPFELLSPILTNGRFSDSFIASFPADGMDPGPSQGRLPAEPLLRNGLVVDAALVRARFPPGVLAPNLGTVFMDSPHRRVARTHQATIGYARQVAPDTSAGADYVHSGARDLLGLRDLNPGVRADTSRTGPVIRVNPAFATSVLQYGNFGRVDYDSLQVYLERRFRRGLSARVSYALGYSRGNTSGNGSPQVLVQQLDDLRLDMNEGPTDFDRRHNFVVSTTASVPRTGGLTVSAVARALSGVPFTIVDSTTDADRNGILFDVLPAGTYAGAGRNAISVESDGRRNGAYGPGAFQLDLRLGYRIAPGGERRLDVFGEIFNLTNASSFDNPVTAVQGHLAADRRLADFLELRALRPGAIPRTGQIGIRLGF